MNAVPDIQPEQPGIALTVVERARVALKSEQTERDFLAMLGESQTITVITNPDGRTQCHARLMDYVKARTGLDAVDEEARKDLVAVNKAIIAERKRLGGIIEDEEKRLRALRDDWDKKIAAEKAAKAEAERQRVAAIQARVDEIRNAPVEASGKTAVQITALIATVEEIAVDESFAELRPQAEGAKASALVKLRLMRDNVQAAEDNQRRLEEERAELIREQANERRLANIRLRMQAIGNGIDGALLMSSADVQKLLDIVKAKVIDASFEELAGEAQAALDEAIETLTRIHGERKEHEEAQAQLAREKAEQEVAAAKERARIAEEERQAKLKREAEERAHQEQLRRQREEEEAKAAERRRILEAEEKAAAERVAAQKAEADRLEAERKAEREAEEKRLADQRADLERQQEALRLQQEQVGKPTDPAEALPTENPPVSESVALESSSPLARKPADEDIICAVAVYFGETPDVAAAWIAAMAICKSVTA